MKNALQWTGTFALIALAAFLVIRALRDPDGPSEKAFFYDVSRRELFTAERGSIPPLPGLDGGLPDGVRAVVVSTNGNPKDRKAWTIAYLETCSPELKLEFDKARATGTAPAMDRRTAQLHRLVRRVDGTAWVSIASPEGERIVTDWISLAPAGLTPVVCTP